MSRLIPRLVYRAVRPPCAVFRRTYFDRPWFPPRWALAPRPRHRNSFDTFFPSGIKDMMEQHTKEMERMMDSCWHPRYAIKYRPSAKEIQVKYDDKVFEVEMDVSQYGPEEVDVRVVGNKLTISAKHQEKADEHGYISRQFTRHFDIPQNVEADSIESILTHEGHLVVKGKVKEADHAQERVINVVREEPKAETTDKEK